MIKSKLFETCQSLNFSELNRLQLFLESKYHNQDAQAVLIIQLYHYIKTNITDENESNWENLLSKENLFAAVFPDQDYITGKIEKLMTKLHKLVKSFISLEYAEENENKLFKSLALSRFYREKELLHQFQLNIQNIQKQHQKLKFRNEEYYKQLYLIEKEITENHTIYNNRKSDANLTSTIDKLGLWHLTIKLRILTEIYSQKIHTNISLKEINITPDDIKLLIKENPKWNVPVAQIYLQAFQLLYKYPEDDFPALKKLKKILKKNEQIFPAEELHSLQSIIRSYTIKKYNEGQNAYLAIVFETYQEHLNAGYIYYKNKIHAASFINIVTFGLKLNKIKWVEQFIHSHKKRLLGAKNPKAVIQLNLALLDFYKREYDKALEALDFNYEDVHLKIASKRLEIKIYYEQKSPILDARIEAFKVYIFRIAQQFLTPKAKTANNNFVDIIRQIIHYKTYKNKSRINKITTKINQLKVIADREWLIEILQQLK